MHRFKFKETLEKQKEYLQQKYPVGTRIELIQLCNDERDMPSGLRGTVMGMDDQPALLMHWDNSRTLSLFPDEDSFRKLNLDELAQEQEEQQQEKGGINFA